MRLLTPLSDIHDLQEVIMRSSLNGQVADRNEAWDRLDERCGKLVRLHGDGGVATAADQECEEAA